MILVGDTLFALEIANTGEVALLVRISGVCLAGIQWFEGVISSSGVPK